jgi:hypothetical protein
MTDNKDEGARIHQLDTAADHRRYQQRINEAVEKAKAEGEAQGLTPEQIEAKVARASFDAVMKEDAFYCASGDAFNALQPGSARKLRYVSDKYYLNRVGDLGRPEIYTFEDYELFIRQLSEIAQRNVRLVTRFADDDVREWVDEEGEVVLIEVAINPDFENWKDTVNDIVEHVGTAHADSPQLLWFMGLMSEYIQLREPRPKRTPKHESLMRAMRAFAARQLPREEEEGE